MKIARILLVFSLLMVLPASHLMAQKSMTTEADMAFKLEKYFAAIPLYRKAYGKTKNKIEKKRILFQIAECYRLTKDPRKAEAQYRRAVRAKYADPILYLRLADVQREQAKYREAMENYKEYIKKVPNDPRGSKGLKSCEYVLEQEKKPSRYKVENVKKLNTRYDDFSPVFADKKYTSLVFTSTRKEGGNKIDPNTGQPFSSLFVAKQDPKGNWSKPVLIDEDRMINTKENNGAATFNRKYNTLYFTRCLAEKKKILGCQVYVSKKRGRLWGEPVALPIAADSIAVGHPAMYKNEREMIFSSDLPNGYGGKDLWIAKRRKKSVPFSKPRNLGKVINTRGNEMFPTLRDLEDGTLYLYFASDGHGGAGGLDIFRSEYVEGDWSEPVNLGLPINSNGDDFGIVFSNARTLVKTVAATRQKVVCEEMGFFTSNRTGGRGKMDIWEFWLPEIVFTLSGTIKDNQTLKLLKDCKVVLVGSDGTSLQTTTDERGYYYFNRNQINKNTTYTMKVTHTGYFANNDGKTTTVGLMKSEDLVVNLNLEPIPPDPIPLPEIQYDLAKWDLKPQFQDSLNGLIETMKKNPTIVIELASHTDFRDTDEKNNVLSFNRAKSVVDYLVTKGIEAGRMEPKGYGESQPRTIKKDITFKGTFFPAGTVLTEEYIKALKGTRAKEAAHQLNRRTEFRILRDDFVPNNENDTLPDEINIQINPDENKLAFELREEKIYVDVILNGNTYEALFDQNNEELLLSLDVVMGLLNQHKLTKKDFNELDSAFTEDGTVKDGMLFNVNSLMVGNKRIYDVEAKCVHGQEAAIIFGDLIMSDIYEYRIDKANSQFIFE
jgi:peptidoglycan-associated lipoprotein